MVTICMVRYSGLCHWSREIAPLFLKHGITRGKVVSSRLSCLTLKSYWREAGWAPEQVWVLWRRKHLLPLSGIKPWFVSRLSHAMVQMRNYKSKPTTSSVLRRGTAFLKTARRFPFNKISKTLNLSMRRWWSLSAFITINYCLKQ